MTTTATAKTSTMFEDISLMCSDNKTMIQASILTFPPAAGASLDKVQAFSYFEDILEQHRLQLNSTTIQQAYAKHVPVSSPAAASEEANLVAAAIYKSFYSVLNLHCLGFFTASGQAKSVAVDEDASKRDPGICFVKFVATVTPADISPLLSAMPATVVTFFLPLPQAPTPSSSTGLPSTNPAAAAAVAAVAAATARIVQALNAGTPLLSIDITNPIMAAGMAAHLSASTNLGSSVGSPTPHLTPTQLFPSTASSTSTVSPGLRPFLTGAAAPAESTFCGPLNFLDDQALFDVVFPPSTRKALASRNFRDGSSIETSMLTLVADCRLFIFKHVIRNDYIGRHDFASPDHLHMTVKRLRLLTLNYSLNGKMIAGNPDQLFNRYLALTPLLPASAVDLWGINLYTQFWSALGEDITRRITRLARYDTLRQTDFVLTAMTTKSRQMSAVRELRTLAMECYGMQLEERRSMRDMFRDIRQNPHTHTSSAEWTMQQHSPLPTARPNPSPKSDSPAATSNVPAQAPACEFPAEFRGCLGCGGEHIFRVCPHKDNPVNKERFHRNFHARNGTTRPPPRDTPYPLSSTPPSAGPTPSHGGAGRGGGTTRNLPSWVTKNLHSRADSTLGYYGQSTPSPNEPSTSPRSSASPSPKPDSKPPARNYALFVQSFKQNVMTDPPLRPMPIRIDNGLPHITFALGPASNLVSLSVLFDSGAALSSGYLPYHQQIMRENPDVVASYEQFDDSNPFEPIKLGGAIRHPDDYDAKIHGQLTAVIRYRTGCFCHDGSPINISFGLGHDMTVNSILGMPTIRDLGMKPDFRLGTVICDDTPTVFPISNEETRCGFSASASTAYSDPAASLPLYASASTLRQEPISLPSGPVITATDDTSNGFLQRTLA
jgi:hypothetical protein